MKSLISVALVLLAGCATSETKVQKTTRAMAPLTSCASTALIDKNLLKQYGEKRQEIGLHQDGRTLVSLYRSRGGDTWTIVLTTPNSVSCLALAGFHWADAPSQKN